MNEKDRRLYAKFTLDFPNHSKIFILSDTAFRCLVEATLWSRDQQTDGFLASRLALAKWSLEALQELSTNDPTYPSLIARDEGWYIHDFAEHQDTKADIETRRERNKVNGQKGGLAKSKRVAKRPAKQPASEVVSENLAETETGVTRVLEPPNGRCAKHLNHTDPPNCIPCGEARKARKAWDDNDFQRRLDAKDAAAAARQAAIKACQLCDEFGEITFDDSVRKCNHQEAVHA